MMRGPMSALGSWEQQGVILALVIVLVVAIAALVLTVARSHKGGVTQKGGITHKGGVPGLLISCLGLINSKGPT